MFSEIKEARLYAVEKYSGAGFIEEVELFEDVKMEPIKKVEVPVQKETPKLQNPRAEAAVKKVRTIISKNKGN